MSTSRWFFLVCYAASGAAALMYQVAWVRQFGLALGHTVASSSIVLAAFMGGLALGALVAGRLGFSPTRALTWYAALELIVAAVAAGIPTGLEAVDPILRWAYADGEAPARFAFVRTAISFVLLGSAATAMGATFPVAVSWMAGESGSRRTPSERAGAAPGRLYAANTIGAAAGAIAAGFWLVPAFGIRTTTWVAVSLNVMAAAGALWLRRWPAGVEAPVRSSPGPARHTAPPVEALPRLAAFAAGISGFGALVFEVAWARLIALIVGPTTYAFAVMAASVIVGLAAGSTLGLRVIRSPQSSRVAWLGALLAVSAIGTVAAAWFAALDLPVAIAQRISTAPAFGAILLQQVSAIGLILAAASVAFGATFTVAVSVADPEGRSPARDAARVYAANTIGAVAGALAAGFVFVPHLGLRATFLHASQLLLGGAAVVFLMAARRHKRHRTAIVWPAAAAVAAGVATMWLPGWDRALLAGGLYKYARGGDIEAARIGLRAGTVDYYREGAAGTVSVKTVGGVRSLAIDGKVDASNGGDMLTQRLLGALPATLHGNPRRALVIGLGSGVTADAVMAAGTVTSLDILEISPEVVDASSYFTPENHDVMRRPGVRLVVGDGRTHLQLGIRQYDLIISEPSNPWMAGVAALFTGEFFAAASARLTEGGVFCQWTHTYELDERDLRSIARTFAEVFPTGTMWLVGDGDLLLIGTKPPSRGIEVARLASAAVRPEMAFLQEDLALPPSSAPFFLFSLYAGGPAELASFGAGAPIQVDDRMALEFSAARAMYVPPPAGNTSALRALANQMTAPAAVASALGEPGAGRWMDRGQLALKVEAFGMAHESFRRAAEADPRDPGARLGAVAAAGGLGMLPQEIAWLRSESARDPANAAPLVGLSSALALSGDLKEAVAAAEAARAAAPDEPLALEQLASVLADLGDPIRLEPVAELLVTKFPDRDEGRYYRAAMLFMKGRVEGAAAQVRELLARRPGNAKAHNLRGVLCAAAGDRACAREAFETSLRQNPRDASVYANLARVHLEEGDRERALLLLNEAAAVDPGALEARAALRDLGGPGE